MRPARPGRDDPCDLLRQAVENDWGDVGYQLFIDDTGRLYEGTYSDGGLSAVCRLDPTGTTIYVNPVNGKLATIDTISGHRELEHRQPGCGPDRVPGCDVLPGTAGDS